MSVHGAWASATRPIAFFYADGRVESRVQDARVRHVVIPEQQKIDDPPLRCTLRALRCTLRAFEVCDFVTGSGYFRCFVESVVADSLPYAIAEGANAAAAIGRLAAGLGEGAQR